MIRVRLLGVVLSITLLASAMPGAALAQTPGVQNQGDTVASICAGKDVEARIELLAQRIGSDSVTSDVRDCYGTLADQDKAQVFEAMAKLQGISLNNSVKEVPYLTSLEPEGLAPEGINWQQLVERTPFSAVGKQLISASGAWYSATACDQNPSDIDYIFLFNFPSAVTNPDALRNFSSNLQVDAMLVYYQVRYGGLNGFGNTDSSRAYVCVGDSGLNTAGGITNVYNNMKLHR